MCSIASIVVDLTDSAPCVQYFPSFLFSPVITCHYDQLLRSKCMSQISESQPFFELFETLLMFEIVLSTEAVLVQSWSLSCKKDNKWNCGGCLDCSLLVSHSACLHLCFQCFNGVWWGIVDSWHSKSKKQGIRKISGFVEPIPVHFNWPQSQSAWDLPCLVIMHNGVINYIFIWNRSVKKQNDFSSRGWTSLDGFPLRTVEPNVTLWLGLSSTIGPSMTPEIWFA